MKIIFYSSSMEGAEKEICEMLKKLAPEETIEMYRSIEELIQCLKRLLDHETIVILRARDREELLHIVSLNDLLQGLRIILLIPNRDRETISIAHRLRPRFLSNGESDFSDTMGVLQKMVQRINHKG